MSYSTLNSKLGRKIVHTTSNPNREHITMCVAINAAGGHIEPYYIFKGERRPQALLQFMDKSQFSVSESGFVNKKAWKEWALFFLAKTGSPKSRGKILLILDGFGCHGNDPETLHLFEQSNVRK
jgi:hypothetical protein